MSEKIITTAMFLMISSVACASNEKLWIDYEKCVKTTKDLSQLKHSQATSRDVGTELYKCVLPFFANQTVIPVASNVKGTIDSIIFPKLVVVFPKPIITDPGYSPEN